MNSKYQYEYLNTHLDVSYCLYNLGIYIRLNLLDVSSLTGKVAKIYIFLHIPPQYWLFSKSACWDNTNEYKNSNVGPKICHFMKAGSFSQFLRIEIFSNMDWPHFSIIEENLQFLGVFRAVKSEYGQLNVNTWVQNRIIHLWNKIMLVEQ